MNTKQGLEKAIRDTIIKYKEIIGGGSPVCIKCLDEIQKQQLIDEKLYDQKLIGDTVRKLPWNELQRNIVIDGNMMIDIKTGEVLGSEVDYTRWNEKF